MTDMSVLAIQFIGLTISFVQLGIAAAQGFRYYRAFPRDIRMLKYLVVTVMILNVTGTLLTSFMYWSFFVNCFRSTSPRCQAWDTAAMILLFVSMTLPFVVQSFYCHRVWIISGKNIYVAIPIILFAVSSYVLGLILIPPQKAGAFSGDAILKISAVGAFQSVLCDSTISLSVYFYLRPARAGVHRTDTRIQNITKKFTSMGFLVCLLAISIFILYWVNGFAAIGGVAMVLRSSYANSLLSTLNARELPSRPQPMDIELPTISVHNSR
ncbi:uncharacterized protein F5147DRAFT_685174 [Suillus discolor]|uniref:DUF6534 domain-containing protein n=1 Tax=Suillus discolor TaxID=1912936 RepID=A0A9P7FBS3_9AGAM|nr:uncharacterized protein F5147DRAFT_685174 [Suillus discolor]KAG2111981.1 hypothetical protein F5147DRAFT_685174 [Suillus discolor]